MKKKIKTTTKHRRIMSVSESVNVFSDHFQYLISQQKILIADFGRHKKMETAHLN